MILVPATMRWHWWRFSAKAFYKSMAASAGLIALQKLFFGHWSDPKALGIDIAACFAVTVLFGFLEKPPNMDVVVDFYSRVRPFGFWKPVREEAKRRGLVPPNDRMPFYDALNGFLTAVFQFSLALLPFYAFLRKWNNAAVWGVVAAVFAFVLYFTWYKKLPARNEE